MAADMSIQDMQVAMQENTLLLHKRNAAMMEEGRYEDPRSVVFPSTEEDQLQLTASPYSIASLPSFDKNTWYYPSHGYEDSDARFVSARGNWGRKTVHDARWIRRGKIAPWAPGMEDWEVRLVLMWILCLNNKGEGGRTRKEADQTLTSSPRTVALTIHCPPSLTLALPPNHCPVSHSGDSASVLHIVCDGQGRDKLF